MPESLNIAIADDEPAVLEFLQEVLTKLGHTVTVSCEYGDDLLDHCRRQAPDLIITDIRMPRMDGLEAVLELNRVCSVPVIVVSALVDDVSMEKAAEAQVLAYLSKPIKERDVAPAISIAMERFNELRSLQEATTHLQKTLAERKVVERAKGILMKHAGLDEGAAFGRLQKMARDRGQKLIQVANTILTASDAFAR